jgi:hypothetical protein
VQPEDLATITPSYTFATPVLGGQAAVAVSAGSAYEMGLAGSKAPETLIFVCL